MVFETYRIFITGGHWIAIECKRINFHCKHNWPISLEIVGSITNMGKRISTVHETRT